MAEVRGTRPGGRSAAVRRRVLQAVRDLVEDGAAEVGFAAVAQRADVHLTTLYRRWGTPRLLMLDALVDELDQGSRMPATGSLEDRLSRYADDVARGMLTPRGLTFVRVLIAAATDADAGEGQARALIRPRLDEYQSLIDDTGSAGITPDDIVHGLLAPIYLRALLGSPLPPGGDELRRLVHNLLKVVST